MGRRILIVEDDGLLAMELEMILGDAGFAIAGQAGSVAEGLAAIETGGIDAAVLDLNLGQEKSEPVADRLAAEGIPFLYVSGHGPEALPAVHRDRPLLGKPVSDAALVDMLNGLLAAGN